MNLEEIISCTHHKSDQEEKEMTILKVQCTQEADCRVLHSARREEEVQVECGPGVPYSQLVEEVAQKLQLNPADFNFQVKSQKTSLLQDVDANSLYKKVQSVVLVDGKLKMLRDEFDTPHESDNDCVEWWEKELSCEFKPKYPGDQHIRFKVSLLSGEVKTITGSPFASLESVLKKNSLVINLGSPVFSFVPLAKTKTLLELGIQEGCTLSEIEAKSVDSVFIKSLTGKQTSIGGISGSTTIKELKCLFQNKEGVPPYQQGLVFKGLDLEDSTSLSEYNIKSNDVIHLILRLRGGMYIDVSSRDGFKSLQHTSPSMEVHIPLSNNAVTTILLDPSEYVSYFHMEYAIGRKAEEIQELHAKQVELEKEEI